MALMKMPCAVGTGTGMSEVHHLENSSTIEASWNYDANYTWIFFKNGSTINLWVLDNVNQTITNSEFLTPSYSGMNKDVPISNMTTWGLSTATATTRGFKFVHTSATFSDVDYFTTNEVATIYA